MRRTEAQAILGALAADQSGLVTSAQAMARGIGGKTLQRLRDAGLLEQVGRGVYQLAGAATPTHLDIRIAWLRLDPARPAWERDGRGMRDGVVSHRSACLLHQLGDIPAPEVELTVPRRLTTREPWVLLRQHDGPLPARDITVVDGLPVTTVDRTILDLLRDGTDAGHIGGVIADAERRSLLDLDTLAARAGGFARQYAMPGASGTELLSALAAEAGQRLRRDEALDTLTRAASAGYADALRQAFQRQSPPEGWTGIDFARMLEPMQLAALTQLAPASAELSRVATAGLEPYLASIRGAAERVVAAQLGRLVADLQRLVAPQMGAYRLDSAAAAALRGFAGLSTDGGVPGGVPGDAIHLSAPVRAALGRAHAATATDTDTIEGASEDP